ncbi:MAG: hypothetical protein GY794_19025 [bacterium]|nr:hypothetical protein [bacterium]
MVESIIVLVAIGVAAALLACRAKKTVDGEGCGECKHDNSCSAHSLDSLSSADKADDDQDG